ncbi:hypothetical protein GCM10011611_10250 [Aliidongia dinghuensis]|uniref:DUF6916 domain-containing protein n=1 Tax=Aliidongia dinghuensis TaxID=1867774 RepID=A0A8J2YQT2_9PROT|nr:hypothetical protein [Aliidongia dinghuensis]GGF06712.1 hypothetical protein GCM10011611_10250 [Aliidongia dinghuensis]
MWALETFVPHLGETFSVDIGENASMAIALIEAGALPGPTGRDGASPFQLQFAGPGPACLAQRTHRLMHDSLGEMAIFLVPIGRHGDGFLYQAVFS